MKVNDVDWSRDVRDHVFNDPVGDALVLGQAEPFSPLWVQVQ